MNINRARNKFQKEKNSISYVLLLTAYSRQMGRRPILTRDLSCLVVILFEASGMDQQIQGQVEKDRQEKEFA
jgi:hypothetical protein